MRNGDFLAKTLNNPTASIVSSLVQPNRLALWASIPGEGKSLVALALLYHIPYGAPFLDMEVTIGNVMIMDSENRLDVLQSRIKKIKRGLENDGYKKQGEIDIQHYSGFFLDDKSTWTATANDIRAVNPSLILIDHLAAFHHQDENSESQMKKVTTGIEDLMQIKGSSVLVLHHFNKNDNGTFFKRLRGSSALYAKADAGCEVRSLSLNNGMLEKVGLIPQPKKDITPSPIRAKIMEGDSWLKVVYDGTYQPVEDPRLDRISHDILHIFLNAPASELSVDDVKDMLAGYASETEIRNVLRDCDKRELLEMTPRQSNKFCYRYAGVPCPWCATP